MLITVFVLLIKNSKWLGDNSSGSSLDSNTFLCILLSLGRALPRQHHEKDQKPSPSSLPRRCSSFWKLLKCTGQDTVLRDSSPYNTVPVIKVTFQWHTGIKVLFSFPGDDIKSVSEVREASFFLFPSPKWSRGSDPESRRRPCFTSAFPVPIPAQPQDPTRRRADYQNLPSCKLRQKMETELDLQAGTLEMPSTTMGPYLNIALLSVNAWRSAGIAAGVPHAWPPSLFFFNHVCLSLPPVPTFQPPQFTPSLPLDQNSDSKTHFGGG